MLDQRADATICREVPCGSGGLNPIIDEVPVTKFNSAELPGNQDGARSCM